MSTQELKREIEKELNATSNEEVLTKVLSFFREIKNIDDPSTIDEHVAHILKDDAGLLKRLAQ